MSLPFTIGDAPLRGERVSNFFENLLPDSGAIRKRLAVRYAAGSEDTFSLLAAIGRDCVGAVQLLALLTTLHEVMPPASVRQQVTNPGFPHVELDAQFMIASTQSLESVPALTASLVA